MEQKGADFHARVRAGYLAQARRWPERYAVVDSGVGPDEVTAALLRSVREWSARAAGAPRPSPAAAR
jgi:dTMP kinase